MKVFIATDVNVVHDGKNVYASQKHSTIFKRYYNAFGKIVLCSRFIQPDASTKSFEDITDILDSIVKIGSLSQMLFNQRKNEIEKAIKDCELVIGRCPSISAYKAFDASKKLKKPFLAESMGDAWDAYWNHSLSGKLIAPYMYKKMKSAVWNSDYAAYVTEEFLQKRYPCKNASVAASNVEITTLDIDALEKLVDAKIQASKNEIVLMTAGAVNVRFKGQEYVVKSLPLLERAGLKVKYIVVGGGDQTYLRNVSEQAGCSDQVIFTGQVPSEKVIELLDQTTVYVQPSLTEGLPRALIEAMSRGCYTLGTNSGGIPELIGSDCVVKKKNPQSIAAKVIQFTQFSEEKKNRYLIENAKKSKRFDSVELNARRNCFYKKIAEDIEGKSR